MGFFDDMATAVQAYPESNVELEIVEFEYPGSALNEGEEATFKIRITNNGVLNMTDVTLKATALNNARVKGPGALDEFGAEAFSQRFHIVEAGGGSVTTSANLHLRAPNQEQPSKNLVRVTLERWDANLDYVLNERSSALSDPRAVLAAEVEGL